MSLSTADASQFCVTFVKLFFFRLVPGGASSFWAFPIPCAVSLFFHVHLNVTDNSAICPQQDCQALSGSFFASFSLRDHSLYNGGLTARPVDHLLEWQTPPTIRLGLRPLLHCGFVRPVAWSTMNTHGLRVSAVAPDEGSSLWMQISTVQAMPLGLPSVHHMTCGVIFLTMRRLWRAPPLLWAFTAPCHLPQKESALLLTMMPHMVLLRGVRSGTDTNGGPPTIRGQQKPRMTWQCPLHGRAWRLLTRYEYMIHGRRRNEQPHRSWQLQTGNGEPSLPPDQRAVPGTGLSASSAACRTNSTSSCASLRSFASSSGAFLQFGPQRWKDVGSGISAPPPRDGQKR